MSLRLYNTLTRTKETFVPIGEVVGMYSCGPTVYNFAHIGNLRTYVFMDILHRILMFDGYKVKCVMNITDVGHLLSDGDTGEDKMAKAAREQKKAPAEIAAFYTAVFFKDIARLNIVMPDVTPKATDHIKEMLEIVVALLEKGFAYKTTDGIYFDISTYEKYGKLSHANLEDQLAGARVNVNTEKKHPADFALWKNAEANHIMQWDSPWGMGFPGWHIECTAMSKKYLGEVFDIHTGGIDHVPIHHENEIAQAECYLGKKAVNTWMHSEFMLVNGGKMSKSLRNTFTIDNLIERNFAPLDFRYFCLNAQYRQKLNFTWDSLESSKVAFGRLKTTLFAHKIAEEKTDAKVLASYEKEFREAFEDDLNVPMAVGVLWKMIKEKKSNDIFQLAVKMDDVFGLGLKDVSEHESEQAPQEVVKLAELRLQARKEKNWQESDRLRNEITALGFVVKDVSTGFELEKK